MIEASTLCCRGKVAAPPVAGTGILFTDAKAEPHMPALKGQITSGAVLEAVA
ncbi:hypothetical protein [Teichococcus wenyumeiae]|uniref:hypothetical protein n=1 Tax=Teichococcus wenyumeiae TaxID=2478470 RepID=UPI0013148A66|nr:hypothetical protein [Pseudoroseomonas wenyumeiae]